MKEMLGDWPCEDDTEASWVEHTVGEIQVQRSFLETHDKFFKEKFTGLKVEIQSLMNDFKGVLQSYGEDIVVLKKAVLQECSSNPKAPPKVRVLELKGFNGNRKQRSWRISYGTWSSSLGLLMFLMTTKYPLPVCI